MRLRKPRALQSEETAHCVTLAPEKLQGLTANVTNLGTSVSFCLCPSFPPSLPPSREHAHAHSVHRCCCLPSRDSRNPRLRWHPTGAPQPALLCGAGLAPARSCLASAQLQAEVTSAPPRSLNGGL